MGLLEESREKAGVAEAHRVRGEEWDEAGDVRRRSWFRVFS